MQSYRIVRNAMHILAGLQLLCLQTHDPQIFLHLSSLNRKVYKYLYFSRSINHYSIFCPSYAIINCIINNSSFLHSGFQETGKNPCNISMRMTKKTNNHSRMSSFTCVSYDRLNHEHYMHFYLQVGKQCTTVETQKSSLVYLLMLTVCYMSILSSMNANLVQIRVQHHTQLPHILLHIIRMRKKDIRVLHFPTPFSYVWL